jgi:hypothetical protein
MLTSKVQEIGFQLSFCKISTALFDDTSETLPHDKLDVFHDCFQEA